MFSNCQNQCPYHPRILMTLINMTNHSLPLLIFVILHILIFPLAFCFFFFPSYYLIRHFHESLASSLELYICVCVCVSVCMCVSWDMFLQYFLSLFAENSILPCFTLSHIPAWKTVTVLVKWLKLKNKDCYVPKGQSKGLTFYQLSGF